jgi:hypothetical protein
MNPEHCLVERESVLAFIEKRALVCMDESYQNTARER